MAERFPRIHELPRVGLPVPVPPGRQGPWSVEEFTVTKEEAEHFNRMRSWHPASRYEHIEPGTYKRLVRDRTVVMSNTQLEIYTHMELFYEVEKPEVRDVLLNGLGLGMALTFVLRQPHIKHITVVERSGDVIMLCGKHYRDKRLEIIQADALTFTPPTGARYNVVWHDIWDTISADNLSTMGTLHRKYGRRCDWQRSWARDLIQR